MFCSQQDRLAARNRKRGLEASATYQFRRNSLADMARKKKKKKAAEQAELDKDSFAGDTIADPWLIVLPESVAAYVISAATEGPQGDDEALKLHAMVVRMYRARLAEPGDYATGPVDGYFHQPVNFLQNTFFRSSALHCTATARILIPAECSAFS